MWARGFNNSGDDHNNINHGGNDNGSGSASDNDRSDAKAVVRIMAMLDRVRVIAMTDRPKQQQ